uniref:Uncharacterized protein n=1 Tax=Solanum tuberosum TaxID=4113 RepID=M1DS99_SOLTU
MAPKAKNVVGSKRSRNGEASGFGSWEPVQKFGKKAVERYGWEWFECQREPKYMGDKYVHEGIEEEVLDLTIAFHSDLTGKLVDVTRTKCHGKNVRYGIVADRRTPITDEEMENMADRYPLTESVSFLCRTGPAFLEPLDDDEATADEMMDDAKDDADDEKVNALMVFDGGDNEA